ncbi:ABC transporter ATP-binding protein [Jannaschia aquimarina]|uniref:UgpC_7 protein n=1 Tax=Jannaschia aquimarina TaxID=935700 RepID=A0A0D1EED5_9RHOB|nr:sn-glycerol-3-phosphate ABC transporter ATP-binding protein UgpC [Jannaschia aquimarina]KIT14255.1 sn-glycerol-3-phosphate import ATP-binding protein UgpC [Jannaschia aquimarina]SNS49337.1 carbohydrate ABC transporter ATP-binding protein, CUT1 family [Jannaschia aquimarina]
MTDALKVTALRKSYGAVDVLRGIDASIAQGEFLVLVGPSGCGKSTMLNCIAGLEETTSGTIEIAGRDVTNLPPRERDIAMVFQSYALYPTMSVRENIAFGMKVRGIDRDVQRAKVEEVAGLLQIGPLLDRRPGQLSGGQRQRVAMGRALVRDPALFLFDEPLSNLDAKLRVEMRAEIRRLHQTTGASIVYVTHDQIEAMTLASRIVVLDGGVVQQAGTPAEIYDAPANTFVADFMGSPSMNLVPARLGEGRLEFGDGRSIALSAPPAGAAPGAEVIAGIRPEAFGPGGDLPVRPDMIENTGSDLYLRFDLAGKPVTARLPARAGLGAEPALAVDTSRICFFDPGEGGRRLG